MRIANRVHSINWSNNERERAGIKMIGNFLVGSSMGADINRDSYLETLRPLVDLCNGITGIPVAYLNIGGTYQANYQILRFHSHLAFQPEIGAHFYF